MQERRESGSEEAGLGALHEFAARVTGVQHDNADLDAVAAEALTALEQADVEAILLKGRALDVLLYDGLGGGRGYSDVDLLVAPSRIERAAGALTAIGYRNVDAVQGVDAAVGAVQAHTWMRERSGLLEQQMIDLHWALPGVRLAPGAAWEALSARTTRVEVAGREAAALDRTGQAMHLALHAAQHGPAFQKHLNELSLALARWPVAVWQSAAKLAQEIGATEAFGAGLRLVPLGSALAAQLALPSSAELEWTIRHRHSEPRGTFYLRALLRPESPRAWVLTLRRSLFPTRAWILYQHPWARGGRRWLVAAYVYHLLRATLWGARAWLFLWRVRRAARR